MSAQGDVPAESINDEKETWLDNYAMSPDSRQVSKSSGSASMEFADIQIADSCATASDNNRRSSAPANGPLPPVSSPAQVSKSSGSVSMEFADIQIADSCATAPDNNRRSSAPANDPLSPVSSPAILKITSSRSMPPADVRSSSEGIAGDVDPNTPASSAASWHGLSNRLSSIEHILVTSQRRALSALLPQVDAARRLEDEVRTLRVENQQLQEKLSNGNSKTEDDERDFIAHRHSMPSGMNTGIKRSGSRHSMDSLRKSKNNIVQQMFKHSEKKSAKQARFNMGAVCVNAPVHPLGEGIDESSKSQNFERDIPLVTQVAISDKEQSNKSSGQGSDPLETSQRPKCRSSDLLSVPQSRSSDLLSVPQAAKEESASQEVTGELTRQTSPGSSQSSQHRISVSTGLGSLLTSSRDSSGSMFLEYYPGVTWQWLHRTGYRDYDERSNSKIEAAYRAGETKIRMKSGKGGSKPTEIFFEDMIQYDPISRNTREIRRLGHHGLYLHVRRFVLGCWNNWKTGGPRREKFDEYQRRKGQLTKDLDHVDYDVQDYYKEHSICASIVRSNWFSQMHLLMVLLNVVWVSVDIDHNNRATIAETDLVFQMMEIWLCVFFMIRLIVHSLAFEKKLDCFRDGWFNLEFALALIMIPEIWLRSYEHVTQRDSAPWHSRISRIFRLLRLLRVAHFVRVASEMFTLLKSISTAMRSVAFTFLWLLLLLYIFGCVFASLTKYEAEDLAKLHFASVGDSMLSLFCTGTLLDGTWRLSQEIKRDAGLPLLFIFLLFIFLSNFISLNLIIGILCQVVARSSDAERAAAEVAYLKRHVWGILECYDSEGNHSIDREAFDCLMENPELHECLNKFGADIHGLMSLGDVLFAIEESPLNLKKSNIDTEKHLTFKQFLEVILRLRGEKHASVTDMVELREFLRQRQDHLEAMILCKTVTPRTSRHRTSCQSLGETHRTSCQSLGEPPKNAPVDLT